MYTCMYEPHESKENLARSLNQREGECLGPRENDWDVVTRPNGIKSLKHRRGEKNMEIKMECYLLCLMIPEIPSLAVRTFLPAYMMIAAYHTHSYPHEYVYLYRLGQKSRRSYGVRSLDSEKKTNSRDVFFSDESMMKYQ